MHLLDVFIHERTLYIWTQDAEGKNTFYPHAFQPIIFFHPYNETKARWVFNACRVEKTTRNDFVRKTIPVLKITFPSIAHFMENMPALEHRLRGQGIFYHVDLPLPEMFLFEHGLMPLGKVELSTDEKGRLKTIRCAEDEEALDYALPCWKILELEVEMENGCPIAVRANGQTFQKEEAGAFASFFEEENPDLILLHSPPGTLIPLLEWVRHNRPSFTFSRVGKDQFTLREKSYFSYGKTYFRPGILSLKGRHLIADYPHEGEGDEFTLLSYIEGARVCRRTLQALVAHSVGNASNNRLLYEAYRRGYLIPYKVGIYERIKPFSFLLENDRGPFTYEPLIGFHSQVYELDFASMYPSIMAAYNLSPEKFRCACCPLEPILATGYSFCRKKKGIVPRVCAYLIRRRQAYKQRDDSISRAKVAYLKWLLVVIFGYQACTHKKIGTIEIHETINAIARETMVDTIHLAEAHGFRVLHAIVDALYVTKKNAPIQDVHALIVDVNAKTGLTLEYKHTFQRMAFLPSLVNTSFPVPGRFYGLTTSGKIKARGIEARQKSQPAVIKSMQRDVLAAMGRHPRSTPYELFRDLIPILRRHLDMLPYALPEHLAFTLRLGREEYHTNLPQKQVLTQLRAQGIHLKPGQSIHYLIRDAGKKIYIPLSLVKDGVFDQDAYRHRLKKAYLTLFLPIHPTMKDIDNLLEGKRQTRLGEYVEVELGLAQA